MKLPESLLRRPEKVDITRYLPAFLSKDAHFKAIADANSEEHDRQRLALLDLRDQAFVDTATWGLDDWEKFLDIPTDKSLGYPSRRATIQSKIIKPAVVNENFLTKLVDSYLFDEQGEVLSYPAEYRIEIIYHGGQVRDYAGLRKSVRMWLPAHLGYKLITITRGELQYHGAGVVQSYFKESIDMASTLHKEVKDSEIYCAGSVIHNYKLIPISGGVLNHG